MDVSHRPPAYWLFPAGLLISLGISLLPGQWPLYVVLAISTAILGLPHGSLDTAVAKRYLHLDSVPRMIGFLAGYMALSAAVIAIWLQVPNIALAVFLLYSAVHFGDDVAHRLGRIGGSATDSGSSACRSPSTPALSSLCLPCLAPIRPD